MNTECLQTLSLDAGLSNLQVSTHYQLVHKQLLQVAVQNNYIMMLPILMTQIEFQLLEEEGIMMPNGVIDYNQITTGIHKAIS
jgi:hypothetical protein